MRVACARQLRRPCVTMGCQSKGPGLRPWPMLWPRDSAIAKDIFNAPINERLLAHRSSYRHLNDSRMSSAQNDTGQLKRLQVADSCIERLPVGELRQPSVYQETSSNHSERVLGLLCPLSTLPASPTLLSHFSRHALACD
jgi:hypothetical protein